MNSVLVIPESSGKKSYVLPNIKFAVDALGLTEQNIRRAICKGCAVNAKGQRVFIDYEYEPEDEDDEVFLKKYTTFDLTDLKTGEVCNLPNMHQVSLFLARSHGYLYKAMHDGAVLKSKKDGKDYRITYVEKTKNEIRN